MIIEAAAPTDLAVVAALHGTAFATPWSEAHFQRFFNAVGTTILVARNSGTVAGFVLYRRAADEAEILSIAVAKSARRQGIGMALLEAVAQAARGHQTTSIFLEVAAADTGAVAFYENAGYSHCGRRPNYYADRPHGANDALLLRQSLDPVASGPV